MLFEDKQKRYKKLLIFVIPLIVLLLVFVFLTASSVFSLLGKGSSGSGSKQTFDIEEYDYHLRADATDLQKDLFKELDTLLKEGADDLTIAECVAKNYVADTYTWDNKKGQWDVGGTCYIYSPHKISMYHEIKDKFYGLLDKYQAEYGNTGLLEVTSVEIEEAHESDDLFEVDDNKYKSFSVNCIWEYSDNSRFASKIAKRQYFKIIKNNDGRFEIVVCHGDAY